MTVTVIQERKRELMLYNGKRVLRVPNLPFYYLKYKVFEGNKISYVLSQTPLMKIYESGKKEITCNFNEMSINVITESNVNKLAEIILEHQQNGNTVKFENFFSAHFAEQNQQKILDIFLRPYLSRITNELAFDFTIDEVFGIRDREIYVKNPHGKKKNFPWDIISVQIKEDIIPNYKLVSSDGKDLIMDADLQKFVTKIFYLLNDEKKNDALFMVQLPRKVQRWIENGDEIRWDAPTEEKEEKIVVPKMYNYFPTPPDVVETLIEKADLEKGMKVLEPSAGQGHILDYLKDYDVTCGELYYKNREILEKKGYTVAFENFMEYINYENYDRIIMNPPFAENGKRYTDIDHVNHAYKMLKKGGILVSVMFVPVLYSSNKKSVKFREFVEKNGYFEELPKHSFKQNGTLMSTVIAVINKDGNP